LAPRPGAKSKLPFATITVSGGRFVENIVLARTDGTCDSLSFSDEVLSPLPLNEAENAAFVKASKQ